MRPPAILFVFVLYTEIFFSGETCEKTRTHFSWYIEMTDQEEKLLEPTEEIIENSEIETGSEIESNIEDDGTTVTGELPDLEEYDVDEPYMVDMGDLLSSILATEEGDTVCSALVTISRQMEIQNKILIKMLSQMQKN